MNSSIRSALLEQSQNRFGINNDRRKTEKKKRGVAAARISSGFKDTARASGLSKYEVTVGSGAS